MRIARGDSKEVGTLPGTAADGEVAGGEEEGARSGGTGRRGARTPGYGTMGAGDVRRSGTTTRVTGESAQVHVPPPGEAPNIRHEQTQ
ncbi:hypothetical protein GCM10027294_21530 [Marinactinospora endophytica]